MEKTLFTRILEGEIPGDIIYQDEHCFAINDINPQAPVHILVIPKKPIPRLIDADETDHELLGHLLLAAGKVAKQNNVGEAFRLLINNGEGAGQTVFHLHLHILGSREFTEDRLV